MAIDRNRLIIELEKPENEGFRVYPYEATTGAPIAGDPTIGIGWDLRHFTLSRAQHETICGWIIDEMIPELLRVHPWIQQLDEPRSRALGNAMYALGVPKLLTFSLMLAALRDGRWLDAKDDCLDSDWARTEAPARAARIAEVFATGEYP